MLLSAVPNPAYMNGTLGVDDTRVGLDALHAALSEYAAAGKAMQGTLAIDEPEPAYAAALATQRFSLNSGLSSHGQDANTMGMGTTGSLGVNYAAPLTRGGFRGEIFNPEPMPTGSWKDAPTPVMLGTESAPSLSPFTKILGIAAIGYATYKLFFDEGRKAAAYPAARASQPRRLRSRTQRLALARK